MNLETRKQIASNIVSRVETGFLFIRDKYIIPQRTAGGPDIAWIRNIYILFSFYFELMLKLVIVLTYPFNDKIELESKLKKLGHNIKGICDQINNLDEIGIKYISFKDGEYKIITFDETIYIKDFSDIRYDFVEGKIRPLKPQEDSIIESSLLGACKILNKIKSRYLS